MWFVYQENEKPLTAKKVKVEDKVKVGDKKIILTDEVFDEKYYS